MQEENQESGQWNSLTGQERQEVLESFEESEDESNLIPAENIFNL